MSIATHLVTVARSLSDILEDINLELLDKGSTAAATLDQVDERIRAIETGSTSLPEVLASDITLSTSANGSSTTSRLLNIENTSSSNKKFSIDQTIQKSVPNLTSNNIKYNTTILDVNGSFTQVQSGETGATASDITKDKVAWVNGNKVIGTQEAGSTISDLSDTDIQISGATESISITNDSGEDKKFSADQVVTASAAGLSSNNIAYGSTILGINGSFTTVTPSQLPSASDITQGKVAYANGQRIEGTNTGGETLSEIVSNDVTLSTQGVSSGYVKIQNTSQSNKKFSANNYLSKHVENLTESNIRHGQTILGVSGSYPSGTMPTTITSNGSGINVQDYAYVNVNVPTGETLDEISASEIGLSSAQAGGSIIVSNITNYNRKFSKQTQYLKSIPELAPENIRSGVTILNTPGSYTGGGLQGIMLSTELTVQGVSSGSSTNSISIDISSAVSSLVGVIILHTSTVTSIESSHDPIVMSALVTLPAMTTPGGTTSAGLAITAYGMNPSINRAAESSLTITSTLLTITTSTMSAVWDLSGYYKAYGIVQANGM